MREVNRAAISGLVDRVVFPDPDGQQPEVPLDMPRGTQWEWTGAGWILVVPVVEVPIPPKDPQPDWQGAGEDLVAIGVQVLQAGQTAPGTLLEEVRLGGHRLIDEGMSRLG